MESFWTKKNRRDIKRINKKNTKIRIWYWKHFRKGTYGWYLGRKISEYREEVIFLGIPPEDKISSTVKENPYIKTPKIVDILTTIPYDYNLEESVLEMTDKLKKEKKIK